MAPSVVFIMIIGILSQEVVASAIKDEQDHKEKNGKSKLPTIVYGPINHQIGNKYQPAEVSQTSAEPAAPEAPTIYGTTTSQNNNRYVTIGEAQHVYLTVPAIDEPFSISLPGFFMSQNISTNGLIFNVDNPTGKQMETMISTFNTVQQTFDRIMCLASPFLTSNERTPLQRKNAREDFHRQTKEIEWLSTVASHRMKLIKLYEQLIIMYNHLKENSELSPQALTAAKEDVRNLARSEKKLKLRTQHLVEYVLLN